MRRVATTKRPMNASRFCAAALALGLTACASPGAKPPPVERTPVMCTQDVMQCPDGRFVGRTPPGCVFVCPAATDVPAR